MTTALATPTTISTTRFGPHRLRKISPDLLDYCLFLPSIWIACAFAISLRLIGPLFVVIPIGFCLLYAMLRSTMPPRLLLTYVVFCIFIAFLSKYQALPVSWQVYFIEEAIVRQLVPISAFLAIAWASKAYFRRRIVSGDVFFGAPFTLVSSLIVGPSIMLQQGLRYEGEGPPYSIIALYGSFINNILIAMFFIIGGIFLTVDWRRYASIATVVVIAATTHFIQFKIVAAAALASCFGVPGRAIALSLAVAFVAIYAVGLGYIPEAIIASPNSGLRLAFVADAISSAIDTYGIGIGYGKESVRWQYHFPNVSPFAFLPDPRSITFDRLLELLSTGIHNSFVQALMRTGVAGFLLFTAAFFAAFPPYNLPKDTRNHGAVVFTMIFVACFVNPALESPVQVVGIGFIYGYLLALRASVQTKNYEAPPHIDNRDTSKELGWRI